jgi:two-component system sensor kinase
VSPLITGALYQARALRLGTPDDASRTAARRDATLDGIGELLSKAMEELHGVIFALRPPDLDDIGVVAAIERYIAQVQRSGLNVHLEAGEEPLLLTPEVRLAIYRIVQEALHNALRHAAADEAVVRFEHIDDVLRVTIRDNGAGFSPEHTARPTALGLLSMRERAAAIGAAFAVMSRPGDGTTVMIERRIDPEPAPVAELEAAGDVPELEASVPKRIPA